MAAETEARSIVARARAEAECISSDAQKKCEDLGARAFQEARVEAEQIVATAVKEARREKEAVLTRLAEEIEAEVRLDAADRQRAVTAAMQCVCGLSLRN